jgi:hypothetical protein
MARGETAVCLGCSKKFKQSEYSLQCTICGLWIHKTCSGITDELYSLDRSPASADREDLLGLQALYSVLLRPDSPYEGD